MIPRCPLLIIAILGLVVSGCGTFMNLKSAPPEVAGPCIVCETECVPFGGTIRSGLLAVVGTECGAAGLITGAGSHVSTLDAAGLFGLGVGALIDTPISFAGDIITLPVAIARWKNVPWATWWGDPGWDGWGRESVKDPVPDAGAQEHAPGSEVEAGTSAVQPVEPGPR
jgi:hypothetical protein